jgi:hypothetical protein
VREKQLILPLIIFVLGMIFTISGALFKIQHWQFASQLLTTGTILEIFGLLILMVILVKYYLKK